MHSNHYISNFPVIYQIEIFHFTCLLLKYDSKPFFSIKRFWKAYISGSDVLFHHPAPFLHVRLLFNQVFSTVYFC